MPHSQRSLHLTDLYRQRLHSLTALADRGAARGWSTENADPTSDPWIGRTAATVTHLQATAVRATSGYLTAFLSSELGKPTTGPQLDSGRYAGVARNGSPVEDGLRSVLIGAKAQIGEGLDPHEALSQALRRAQRTIGLDIWTAARNSLRDGLKADERFIGWRRAVKGTCDACLGLAQEALSPPGTPLEIHPGCQCVSEPSVRNLPNRFPRPSGEQIFSSMTPEQQDAAVGPDKASLLRSGELTLAACVGRSQMDTEPDFITSRSIPASAG